MACWQEMMLAIVCCGSLEIALAIHEFKNQDL